MSVYRDLLRLMSVIQETNERSKSNDPFMLRVLLINPWGDRGTVVDNISLTDVWEAESPFIVSRIKDSWRERVPGNVLRLDLELTGVQVPRKLYNRSTAQHVLSDLDRESIADNFLTQQIIVQLLEKTASLLIDDLISTGLILTRYGREEEQLRSSRERELRDISGIRSSSDESHMGRTTGNMERYS